MFGRMHPWCLPTTKTPKSSSWSQSCVCFHLFISWMALYLSAKGTSRQLYISLFLFLLFPSVGQFQRLVATYNSSTQQPLCDVCRVVEQSHPAHWLTRLTGTLHNVSETVPRSSTWPRNSADLHSIIHVCFTQGHRHTNQFTCYLHDWKWTVFLDVPSENVYMQILLVQFLLEALKL